MTTPQHTVPILNFAILNFAILDFVGTVPSARGRVPRRSVRYSARMSRTATCVWRVDPALILALDEHLGPPVDSYVNGSQTWISNDGPGAIDLEWRLHPVAGYRLPRELSHYDLWEQVVGSLSAGTDPDALTLGTEARTLRSLWDGLECFAAYGDEPEPAPLAQAASAALGRPPDAAGLVDHDAIGAAWEQARGATSLVEMVFAELKSTA